MYFTYGADRSFERMMKQVPGFDRYDEKKRSPKKKQVNNVDSAKTDHKRGDDRRGYVCA